MLSRLTKFHRSNVNMKDKTVFIFGAGSTKALNMPLSEEHKEIFRQAAKNNDLLQKLYDITKSRFNNKEYGINDVYNLIDNALMLQVGLSGGDKHIEYIELLKAKKELICAVFTKILQCIEKYDKELYEKYIDFYYRLAKEELTDKLRRKCDFTDRDFFISNYSVVNFNWDVYSLFPLIDANRKLNHENDRYMPVGSVPQLRMYTDFNYECAANSEKQPWYPFTEPAAHTANSESYGEKRRVVLTKAYFPHGLMNSFKCPKCARHSLFLGNFDIESTISALDYGNNKKLCNCINCSAEIHSNDFNVLVQSNFKTRNAFLEETRIKMFCELESAERLVFIGYSLPADDTDYATFFKSLSNVKEIYVVLKDDVFTNGFKKISSLSDLNEFSEETRRIGERYFAVNENLYLSSAGFPEAAADILKIAQ